MKNIDKLKNVLDLIKNEIYALDYPENDIRIAYFENLYSIINEFYLGKVFFEISTEIKNGNIKFDAEIMDLQPHILKVYEVADIPLLSNGFHNDLNRKLFVDSFTNFEVTIDLCFENLKTDAITKAIVTDLNTRLIKLIEESHKKEEIINQLVKSSFIPLLRKFKFLSKRRDNCYGENYAEDLKFISFCGKLRNCVLHSAGYYKGKYYEYEFEDVKFIFKNDEFLEMLGENDYIFLKINERLTYIASQLFNCLSDIEFLKYPDDGF
ncbi:hypothetical protein GCM10009430_37500 [Aquimarina litoralis]|uniref:Apea-like HEPN domain-containing protein n=1 Tax=Aquimarina litoralis TaxID=584605 RepID=A0ABP3UDP5_9FLAO